MSGASAFDPSTWGEVSGGPENPEVTAAIEAGKRPEVSVVNREVLNAELADLRELERSTQAQLDKASATVTAAKVELSQLRQRIAEVEQDIADADTEGEG